VKFGQWLGLIVLAISLYVIWQIRQLLLMAFAAILLATSLNQLARLLRNRFKLKKGTATLGALVIFLLAIISFSWLIVPPLATQFREIAVNKLPRLMELSVDWRNQLSNYLPAPMITAIPDAAAIQEQVQPIARMLLGGSLAVFSSSVSVVLNLLLLLVLTIMLLVQPESYRKVFVMLFPQFYRRRVEEILDECEVSLGKWVVGALISMLAVALMSTVGLWALGIPYPLAQGVLAGLLNFIPNLGPTLSVVLPMGLALLDSPWKPLLVLGLYFIIQQIESSLLTPYIMAQQVSLLPALTLLAQVFFASAFGFLGLLLALPLSVVFKVWFNAVVIEDVLDRWRKRPSNGDVNDRPVVLDPWELPSTESELVMMKLAPTDGES
jgi:predicted PurR-regulated permease PerM